MGPQCFFYPVNGTKAQIIPRHSDQGPTIQSEGSQFETQLLDGEATINNESKQLLVEYRGHTHYITAHCIFTN